MKPPTRTRARALRFVLVAANLVAACASAPHDDALGRDTAEANELRLAEKDLAIAFALEDESALTASTSLGGAPLLSRERYARVADAFRGTNVEDAFDGESVYEDWRLISFRVAPCSSLAPAPIATASALCWPEVRLVLQPVLRDVRIHERSSVAYADDRAIHALYDAPPESVLASAQAARARELVKRARGAASGWGGGPFAPLSSAELQELVNARNAVARGLLLGARALRDSTLPSTAFTSHGVRPESAAGATGAVQFAARVTTFLSRYAQPGELRAMTAFSLPPGREPAHADEWVFVGFRARDGSLQQEGIKMTSTVDGRVLVDMGLHPSAHQISDDVTVHDAAKDPARAGEIAARAMLGPADIARLTPALQDRRTTLVPNTTCGSCHKMNLLRFDFHNLGYLEDRDLTVSPRVVTDVSLDLAWIRENLEKP